MPGGDEFAFLAEERRVVDGEDHAHRRLVNGDGRHGFRVFDIRDGIADFEAFQTNDGADFTGVDFFHFCFFKAIKHIEAAQAVLLYRPVLFAQGYHLPILQRAAVDAADGDTADIVGIVQRRHQHLEVAFLYGGGGHMLDDGVEQRGDILGAHFPVGAHPAIFPGAVQRREVQLVF